MMRIYNDEWTVIDAANTMVAVTLVLSPSLFGYAESTTATWSAALIGMLIGMVALARAIEAREWQDWANLVLGLWAATTPRALGFSDLAFAAELHVIAGLAVAITSALRLAASYLDPPTRTA
jgi:hypothetical protein